MPSPFRADRAKDVTHPAHGLDVVAGLVGIAQFLAKLADVHVNAAVEGRKLAAEHDIHQALSRNHAAGLAQQDLKQIELDRSQLDRLPLLANGTGGRIEFDIPYLQQLRNYAFRASCRGCGAGWHGCGPPVPAD